MNRITCSCCNRSFESSELRHHGVGGGVREKNELLCADCWKVFSTDSWDDNSKPQSGEDEHPSRKRKLQEGGAQDALGTLWEDPENSSEAVANKLDADPHFPEEPLDHLRRLSGAGVLDPGSAFARALVQKHAEIAAAGSANQVLAEDKGSGGRAVTEPMKRAGSALARDRSGRFIGKSKQADKVESSGAGPSAPARRGNIDPDDPLEQDLMVSQAHLFDDAPVRGPAESLNAQVTSHVGSIPKGNRITSEMGFEVSQNTVKQEVSGEVLSPAARMQANSPVQPQAVRVRSGVADTDCLAELKQMRSKVATLEQTLLAARLQTLCIMCKAAARSTVAWPCGHVLYCAPCMAARVAASGTCPECSSPIVETHAVIFGGP